MRKTLFILVFWMVCGCKNEAKDTVVYDWIPLKVTATAYNSVSWQTSFEHPKITAWGDSIMPGVKWIAVSRDLLRKGLRHNTMVKIDTFDGIYLVKDKMHSRWTNRIDIYMGTDVEKAREWGRRKVQIQYAIPKESPKKIAK